MKSFARFLFRWLAAKILRRYQPLVIGIAGSIGKTATKEAIATVLNDGTGNVRATAGNFNAEIGVPVTIISGGQARRSLIGWCNILVQGFRLLIKQRPYPAILILEVGTDRPGDLAPLIQLAQPKIGILTAITPEHLEFFGDLDAVASEEAAMVRQLGESGVAILNADDEYIQRFTKNLKARVISYGWSAGASVRATSLEFINNQRGFPSGFLLNVRIGSVTVMLHVPGVIGRHQAYPVLAALAVAQAQGLALSMAVERLQHYQPPPGRMRLFDGRAGTLVIDDSYNASPTAMAAALETLWNLAVPGRKFVVLGQMSELGSAAAYWHDWVGQQIPSDQLAGLITLGPLAARIGEAAKTKGFPGQRHYNVPNAEAAAAILNKELQAGDVVLLKGSRYAARLERAVELLLDQPDRDRGQLVH